MIEPSPELPNSVVARLDAGAEDPGTRSTVSAAGIPFSSLQWGDPGARPLLLIHGVTASARIWWRIGPALATTGRSVLAVDLPGHGFTGHWGGHHRFRDNAIDVAAWIQAAGLATSDLQVVGHSWGAMTAAALPGAGVRPATLVLLDPPAISRASLAEMVRQAAEQLDTDQAAVPERLRAENPGWSGVDIEAKAEAMAQLDREAARAVLLDNGDWDGGLADLADPAAAGIPTWIIRGDPSVGGMLPIAAVPPFEALIGAGHVITLRGAPHAPQRTHPMELMQALLHALGGS